MAAQPLKKLNHTSLQQAAQWYVCLHDQHSTELERQRWQAWFEQNGEHQDAWHYVERVSQRFAPLQADKEQHAASRALRNSAGPSRRQTLASLMILASGSLLGWSAWRGTSLPRVVGGWTADLTTGTGQTREVLLEDGSRLWLKALSAVDQQFSDSQRLLTLRFGEVLINTATDPRPFRVQTDFGLLRALGTRFSVQQSPERTLLNVYQGAVEVRGTERGQTQVVEAGQQLGFNALGFEPSLPASPAREAWTRGILLADNLPLGKLVEELARYRSGHLACDPSLAALPVMGSFPLNDSDQALRLLQAALPIRIERLMPWWVSIEPAV